MSEDFYKFPKGEATIMDDVTAWQLIESFGIMDGFLGEAALTHNTIAHIHEGHPTHWCLCVRISGNPEPTENGFMIRAFPKSQVQLAAVIDFRNRYFEGAKDITIRFQRPDGDV